MSKRKFRKFEDIDNPNHYKSISIPSFGRESDELKELQTF